MKIGSILNDRYTVLNKLGEGTFSTVWHCKDEQNNIDVAIKFYKTECYSDKLAAKMEYKLLDNLDHPNIISLLDKFIYYDTLKKNYCLVYEICDCNLFDIMDLSQDNQIISIKKIDGNFIYYQIDRIFIIDIIRNILEGLHELHSQRIIHTDIKPENILFKNNIAKIADFNTAEWEYTCDNNMVGTRYYRAPEVILGLNITTAYDIWSVGCLLFELITNDVLFYPHAYNSWKISRDEDHLALIVELLGPIPSWMLNGRRTNKFINLNGKFKNIKQLLPWNIEQVMNKKYKIDDPLLVDLLNKMLVIDPYKRSSAKQCLEHPFLC